MVDEVLLSPEIKVHFVAFNWFSVYFLQSQSLSPVFLQGTGAAMRRLLVVLRT